MAPTDRKKPRIDPEEDVLPNSPGKKASNHFKFDDGADQKGMEESDDSDDYSDEEFEADSDLDKPRHPIYSTSDEEPDSEEFKYYMAIKIKTQCYVIPETSPGLKLSISRLSRLAKPNKDSIAVQLSQTALNWYMEKDSGGGMPIYEFVRVEHANAAISCGFLYRLVFVARHVKTASELIFKAMVLHGIECVKVKSCELAPELAQYCTQLAVH